MTRVRSPRGRRARRLAALLCFAAIGTASGAPSASDVVARLGTTDITVAQLHDFIATLDPAVRKQALDNTSFMNDLVRTEIERMAVLRAAAAQKWDQRPDIAIRIARARDEVIANSFLASASVVPPDFPSDGQIQQAYTLNRDNFMQPRQYHLQQIFVALPASSDEAAIDAAQKKAEDLARRAKAKGADFAALAHANSEEKASAAKGGDLGWADETQIVPEIRNQALGMNAGDVTDPIRLGDGWHIIRLVDTKPAAPRPLVEVRDTIIAALRQRKQQENENAYIAQLLDKTPISVNEVGLHAIFEAAN